MLKNDGVKFLEMMEQLANRRMVREDEAAHEIETAEVDDETDDEDHDGEDDDDEYVFMFAISRPLTPVGPTRR